MSKRSPTPLGYVIWGRYSHSPLSVAEDGSTHFAETDDRPKIYGSMAEAVTAVARLGIEKLGVVTIKRVYSAGYSYEDVTP